jgi:uncharacterized protein YcfJ
MATYSEEEVAKMLGVPEGQATVAPSPVKQLQEQLPPSAWEQAGQLVREYAPVTGEIGGAIGGAIQGGRQGWQVGKVPGAVVGTIAGAAAGRLVGETAADIAGDEVDILDTLENTGEAALYAALGEGAFSIISKGVKAIRNIRAGAQLSPADQQALAELNQALINSGVTTKVNGKVVPVQLTPAQITQSGFQKNLERIALSGMGGGAISDLYKAQNTALKSIFDSTVKAFGRSGAGAREATGKAFQESLEQVEKELMSWAEPKYAALDGLAKKTPMSFASVGEWARQTLVKNSQNLRPNRGLTGSISDIMTSATRLPKEQEKVLKRLLQNERNMTFKDSFAELKRLTTELREIQSNTTKKQPELVKFYNETIERMHTMMDKQAQKMGSSVYQQFKEVSDVYRGGMTNLRGKAIAELATKAPERVGETIFANGNVTLVKDAFKAIDDAAELSLQTGGKGIDVATLKGDLKAGYLDSLFKRVQSEMTDSAADKASTVFGKLKGDPALADTFNAVLSKKEQAEVMKVLGWAEKLEAEAAGNFSLIVRGKQSQSLNTLVTNIQSAAGFGAAGTAALGGVPAAIAATTVAMGLITAPNFIAKRAVQGKVTNKLLSSAQKLVKKAGTSDFDWVRDGGALVAIVAQLGVNNEDLPEDMRQEGIEGSEALLLKMLEGEAPMKGFPVTNQ